MSRLFDRASELEQETRDAAVAATLAGIRRPRPTESALVCGHCGEAIPEARRLAEPGCQLCVPCKSRSEKNPAQRRR
ncbi:TraR/DksA C4-type zinc finger protein [Chitinimonas viridis]|uniref:TraR/DksA C4-type zinc finger protein n=1 Tax=Chitinimonas viridis TaxID=664880 RepID=A0ABT8BAT1_9NEIS|nr:TraR/DksA C4-type zinc finger protein [Chitinimonas viridis]MDN3578696.1 TraR/DksA C4-type zinc finger protein [Chitinimonas viridis]